MLDNTEEIKQAHDAKRSILSKEIVTLDNVGFRYNVDGEWVLQNINLRIPKGQILAVVGSSGSGKSTLADLLPRFHDVSEGSIRIDGTDIRELNMMQLRSLMGIVNQDPVLVS